MCVKCLYSLRLQCICGLCAIFDIETFSVCSATGNYRISFGVAIILPLYQIFAKIWLTVFNSNSTFNRFQIDFLFSHLTNKSFSSSFCPLHSHYHIQFSSFVAVDDFFSFNFIFVWRIRVTANDDYTSRHVVRIRQSNTSYNSYKLLHWACACSCVWYAIFFSAISLNEYDICLPFISVWISSGHQRLAFLLIKCNKMPTKKKNQQIDNG